jgi:hypothetical protein
MGRSSNNVDIVFRAKDESTRITRGVKGEVQAVSNSLVGTGGLVAALGLTAVAWQAFDVGKRLVIDAYGEVARLESTMVSLRALSEATGRSFTDVMRVMSQESGGLATRVQVATGLLRGLTTTLTVDQIGKLTRAIRDASIAMGEDFNVQLPMIIKAIKQLNPAILDNIGVTVRLDQVNQRITQGYYGLDTAINEATQQNAIYQEVIAQTQKYQGLEEEFLKTAAGAWKNLTAAISDNVTATIESSGTVDVLNDAMNSFAESMRNSTQDVQVGISFWERGILIMDRWSDAINSWLTGNESQSSFMGDLIKFMELSNEATGAAADTTAKAVVEEERFSLTMDGVAQSSNKVYNHLLLEKYALEQTAYGYAVAGAAARDSWLQRQGARAITDTPDRVNPNRAADDVDAAMQARINAMQNGLSQELIAWQDAEHEKVLISQEGYRQQQAMIGEFSGIFVNAMYGTVKGLDDVWNMMVADFANLALKGILNAILPGSSFVASFLGAFKFWDEAANDRALIEEGKRAAGFITQGLNSGIKDFQVPSLTGYGGMSRQRFRSNVMPEIERSVRAGYSNIQVGSLNMTGGPVGRFY